MACGCTLRGVTNTPADHLARARALEMEGNYAEARRHVAMARQSLNVLRGLNGLGVAADNSSTLASRTDGLTDAEKAELRNKLQRIGEQQQAGTDAVTRMVANIVTIVSSALQTIFSLPFFQIPPQTQQDITRAFRWIQAFFSSGRQLPPLTGDDLIALRGICQFWSQFGGMVSGGINTAEAAAYASASSSADSTGRLSDVDAAMYSMLQFAARTLTAWCGDSSVQALIRPRPDWSPEAVARAEAVVAARRAALTPQAVAINNFRNALLARALSETAPAATTMIPWGSRRFSRAEFDCLTSAALLTTAQAYVATFPGQPLPRQGRFFIASPQGYITTPPAGACPPPGSPPPPPPGGGGGGSTSESGGNTALLLGGAAVLAAVFFLRR